MTRNKTSTKERDSSTQIQFKRYGNGEVIKSSTGERKSGKYLTLAIMGGAAFFVLRGCDDSQADNDGDGVFYASPQTCVDDGNSAQLCTEAWNNAKAKFESELPKYMSQDNCLQQYAHCYYDNIGQGWTPVLAGFLLSQTVRKNRDENDTYSSSGGSSGSSGGGGGSYSSRAVWNTSTGDYAWRSGTKLSADNRYAVTVRKVATISRGGYGRFSIMRGSWGG